MADFQIPDKTLETTVDRSVDSFLFYDNSASALRRTRVNNMLNITGAPVGDTDTQTLTNKTLTAPTISSPVLSGTLSGTYTIGGTPTFPSSVVTLTGSQTLTNKVLTSPTINTATIANPTLTVDSISEFTGAAGVTIDGLNIKDSKLNTNNSVITANITDSAVTAAKIADSAVTDVKKANTYGFCAYQNSSQSISASTFTKVSLQVEEFDNGSVFDNATNYRLTAPIDGVYHIDGACAISSVGDTNQLFVTLYKNGTEYKRGSRIHASTGLTSMAANVSVSIELSANDYIELYIWQSSGGLKSTAATITETYLSGHFVGTS